MANFRSWFVVLFVVGACTCGARTECKDRAFISFLTSVHDDHSCQELSAKGVLLSEAAKLLAEVHNNKTNSFDIEVTVLDTCGSITGALKAAMKALVTADIECLQPPHFLGIIGPETKPNAEAVHTITSVLKVPQIVQEPSNSAYLHYLPQESDTYLVQGALEIIERLKWKSFTLVANADEDNEDDVQSVARKLTISAVAKKLCINVHDKDEEDLSSHIVHIGKPEEDFFDGLTNTTVLIISGGSLKRHLNLMNSTNTVLLLENSRNEYSGLEGRVESSDWWSDADVGIGKYNDEQLKEVRWLETAIGIYTKALDTLCKQRKCKSQINSVDWNNVVSNMLATHKAELQTSPTFLNLSIKLGDLELESLGCVIVRKNKAKVYWNGQKIGAKEGIDEEENDEINDDASDESDNIDDHDVPRVFKSIRSRERKSPTACVTNKEMKILQDERAERAHVFVAEVDDSEWWTMVSIVSGVGVAMFVVGIFAVYVVYTNIRGPVSPKHRDRDTSLRSVQTGELATVRHPRPSRQQRRNSTKSISSTISDKSV